MTMHHPHLTPRYHRHKPVHLEILKPVYLNGQDGSIPENIHVANVVI